MPTIFQRRTLVTLLFLASFFLPSSQFSSKYSARTKRGLSCGDQTMEYALFGKFKIPTSHIFLKTKYSFGFVNLRPIVPGHVLISPHRVCDRLQDLSTDEYNDLWQSVRRTQEILSHHYGPSAFNVAVQDGAASGQSVPHVHVHILPRSEGDFERNDDVYDELQEWAPREEVVGKMKLDVPDDEDREDRTSDQMADEALTYKNIHNEI
mmetsp:Transcript_26283/g.39796  ORF Transcript_26283/g.39796 Transcript_26283/m.39796 type:complete len:208 (-) Transcript_26283:1249-1872(-)